MFLDLFKPVNIKVKDLFWFYASYCISLQTYKFFIEIFAVIKLAYINTSEPG